ncbi:MAG: peptidase T [Bacteroidota bacterium]
MALTEYKYTVLDRFLKYVTIDTQSDPTSTTVPSTMKQKDLAKVLVEELVAMGISDAHMDQWGYVYATIPATSDKDVPVICFCSHMDTSPDASGTGVKPIVHQNYQGQDLILPDDLSIILRESDHPDLTKQHGNDIVTASGTTLLGADNKSGVAEIMDAAHFLMQHPEVPHGTIKILFTPDEEIGRGADKVDLEKLGAQFGYTVDGETAGSMEDETFSADGAVIEITGVPAHPGFAKDKMESAIKIASEIVASLPKDRLTPETTELKQGFIHPTGIQGSMESAKVSFILRDFEDAKLREYAQLLQGAIDKVLKNYPNSKATLAIKEQYRNMKNILKQHPEVADYALEAIRRAGLEPIRNSIRGGTDGSRLSYMGLPCPNIFAGEHAFHSKYEWVSVQDMHRAVDTIVHLCQIWEERAPQ